MSQEKRSITPEKVVKILQENGTNVTQEEAQKILQFLYKFGKLTLEKVFKR
jgi:Ca2+-binding EF-hand superfamily protein